MKDEALLENELSALWQVNLWPLSSHPNRQIMSSE